MQFEKVIAELKKMDAKRVFIQYPEGIKRRIQETVSTLEKENIESVVCLEMTFGACDVREDEARRLNCDAILHVGHEDFGVKTKLPVFYVDWFIEANPIPALEKNFKKLEKYERIGLVTSLQFVQTIEPVRKWLESHGKKVFTEKHQQYEGQMLGCRVGAGKLIEDKVDCFLCIGAGKFYGLGLALETKKPMLNLDIEMNKIHEMEDVKKKIQRITAWNLSALKDAKRVGLLVSWKRGQMFGSPFLIKRRLEKQGKEVFIFAMDELSQQKLEGLKIDAFINFSCPRIGTDDLEKYKIPFVNYTEIMKEK